MTLKICFMKYLLLFFLSCTFLVNAQVTNQGNPKSWSIAETKSDMSPIVLPKANLQQIKKQDDTNDKLTTKPYRIGISHKVNFGLDNAGFWTQLSNGDRVWRILFSSPDAVHLSVNFNDFFLPEGSNIYLYNDDKTDLIGAYTTTQNNDNKVLGTWFVNGDKLWVEYYEPKAVKDLGKLNINSVVHGYRLGHTYQKGYHKSSLLKINNSGDCNHDVDCPIGNNFETQKDVLKKSVGFLSMGDGYICSGALINNVEQDKKLYFLSANHCLEREIIDPAANPAIFSMRFNWISPDPVCASIFNSTDSVDEFTLSGSTLRAENANSDVMLLEISGSLPTDWDVTFAGWDNSDTDPTFEVGIHHPRGDIMKVCRDDTGATKRTSNGKELWLIGGLSDGIGVGDGWELGVTEGGSSGSPLFNENGHIIGQLFGGEALCTGTSDNNDYDLYGRFATSWSGGGTAATQLKAWLDPQNTNANTLDALENTLAINDEFLEINITVYPNPTTGLVNIKSSGLVNDLKYEVYNVLGQTLLAKKLQNNQSINLSNLPNDIYFVKIIEIETNKSLVKKIVLNK